MNYGDFLKSYLNTPLYQNSWVIKSIFDINLIRTTNYYAGEIPIKKIITKIKNYKVKSLSDKGR